MSLREDLHKLGIELPSCELEQLFVSRFEDRAFSVGARGRDRVESVGNGEDACANIEPTDWERLRSQCLVQP